MPGIKNIFRISDWKDAPLLILLTGFFIWSYYYQIEFDIFLHNLVYLFLTALFMGSFGYYLNDFFDIEKDAIAGKSNFASGHSLLLRLVIIFTLLFLTFAIWYFLCGNKIILFLLATEILLFFLYSVPGIRIKERPFLSVVTDAFYAYVMWGIIVLFLCKPDIDSFSILHFIYLFWLLALGIRGILSHHVSDHYNDLQSGTQTTSIRYGKDNITVIQKLLIPPIEGILFITFLFLLYKPLVLIYIGFIVLTLRRDNVFDKVFNDRFLNPETGLISGLMDNFYIQWLPVIFLTLLSASSVQYLWVWLFYIPFYFTQTKEVVHFIVHFVKIIYYRIFGIGSFIVNYLIFFLFLLFGVNLIKEKKSALEYLRSKWK